jgi:mannosyl-oligosaccharide alpha-1,2-mannosidase
MISSPIQRCLKYQKRAYAALSSIEKYCKLEHGYGGIGDVRFTNQNFYINQTETFFFAELLKYLYLTFADPNIIHLDEWVVSQLAISLEHIRALKLTYS